MKLPNDIDKNLQFLCIEVDSQLENLQAYFDRPGKVLAKRILDRRNYAYNLKTRIHNASLKAIAERTHATNALRCAEFTASDLEQIADLCRECIKQAGHLDDFAQLGPTKLTMMLERVRDGLTMMAPAMADNDTQKAMQIGQLEEELDDDFDRLRKRYIAALKTKKKYADDISTAILIAHNVEKMGDLLLNISENIVSAILGQPLNFDRLESLQSVVGDLEGAVSEGRLRVEPLAYTRSGSAISGVRRDTANLNDDQYLAVFKEGEKQKLKDERKGVESWNEIYPGLAPRILSYKKRGQSASLLIEHLPGMTFQDILLNGSPDLLEESTEQLSRTLLSVWQETRIAKPAASGFIQQLLRRLPEVYKLHPEFCRPTVHIGGLELSSFDALLEKAATLETRLAAPFSTYIHGDFNVDNIIYDPLEKRINFIDLHRSRHTDYVQDISVFMVSNFRLQVLDTGARRRIMNVARNCYQLARQFASQSGDHSFELRLALGLVRSFASSTRFTLDKTHARSMFLSARYLLELTLRADPAHADQFRLPIKEIFIA